MWKHWGKQCLRAVKQVIKSEEEPLSAGGAAAQIIVMAPVYLKAQDALYLLHTPFLVIVLFKDGHILR